MTVLDASSTDSSSGSSSDSSSSGSSSSTSGSGGGTSSSESECSVSVKPQTTTAVEAESTQAKSADEAKNNEDVKPQRRLSKPKISSSDDEEPKSTTSEPILPRRRGSAKTKPSAIIEAKGKPGPADNKATKTSPKTSKPTAKTDQKKKSIFSPDNSSESEPEVKLTNAKESPRPRRGLRKSSDDKDAASSTQTDVEGSSSKRRANKTNVSAKVPPKAKDPSPCSSRNTSVETVSSSSDSEETPKKESPIKSGKTKPSSTTTKAPAESTKTEDDKESTTSILPRKLTRSISARVSKLAASKASYTDSDVEDKNSDSKKPKDIKKIVKGRQPIVQSSPVTESPEPGPSERRCPVRGCDSSGHLGGVVARHFTPDACPLYHNVSGAWCAAAAEERAAASTARRRALHALHARPRHMPTLEQRAYQLKVKDMRSKWKGSQELRDKLAAASSDEAADDREPILDGFAPEYDMRLFREAQALAANKIEEELSDIPTDKDGTKYVYMGKFIMKVWYQSPYPGEAARVPRLYICEFCLQHHTTLEGSRRHEAKCLWKYPPGDEIYRKNNLSVFQVDGRKQKQYCQQLCLLAKFFLDHKTLYYDVEPFLFYVMTKADAYGCHIVGYFSKEKNSFLNYNVSCILTLPPYQRKGFGKMLIQFSYLLTKVEGKVGSPETPLSDLGLISYRSYWKEVLLRRLATLPGPFLNIRELSKDTSIATSDIVSTLQERGLMKYWKGKHILLRKPEMLEEMLRRDDSSLSVDPACLIWTPPPVPGTSRKIIRFLKGTCIQQNDKQKNKNLQKCYNGYTLPHTTKIFSPQPTINIARKLFIPSLQNKLSFLKKSFVRVNFKRRNTTRKFSIFKQSRTPELCLSGRGWSKERQQRKKPDSSPYKSADQSPEKEPDKPPHKKPDQSPKKEPDKSPHKKPDQSHKKEPDKSPHKRPYRSPEKEPDKSPHKRPYRSPKKEPDKSPFKRHGQSPRKDTDKSPCTSHVQSPIKDPDKSPCKGHGQSPKKKPDKSPCKRHGQSPEKESGKKSPDESPKKNVVQISPMVPGKSVFPISSKSFIRRVIAGKNSGLALQPGSDSSPSHSSDSNSSPSQPDFGEPQPSTSYSSRLDDIIEISSTSSQDDMNPIESSKSTFLDSDSSSTSTHLKLKTPSRSRHKPYPVIKLTRLVLKPKEAPCKPRDEEAPCKQTDEEAPCKQSDEEAPCKQSDEEAPCEQSDEEAPCEQSDEEAPCEQSDEEAPCEQSDEEAPCEQSDEEAPCEQSDEEAPCEQSDEEAPCKQSDLPFLKSRKMKKVPHKMKTGPYTLQPKEKTQKKTCETREHSFSPDFYLTLARLKAMIIEQERRGNITSTTSNVMPTVQGTQRNSAVQEDSSSVDISLPQPTHAANETETDNFSVQMKGNSHTLSELTPQLDDNGIDRVLEQMERSESLSQATHIHTVPTEKLSVEELRQVLGEEKSPKDIDETDKLTRPSSNEMLEDSKSSTDSNETEGSSSLPKKTLERKAKAFSKEILEENKSSPDSFHTESTSSSPSELKKMIDESKHSTDSNQTENSYSPSQDESKSPVYKGVSSSRSSSSFSSDSLSSQHKEIPDKIISPSDSSSLTQEESKSPILDKAVSSSRSTSSSSSGSSSSQQKGIPEKIKSPSDSSSPTQEESKSPVLDKAVSSSGSSSSSSSGSSLSQQKEIPEKIISPSDSSSPIQEESKSPVLDKAVRSSRSSSSSSSGSSSSQQKEIPENLKSPVKSDEMEVLGSSLPTLKETISSLTSNEEISDNASDQSDSSVRSNSSIIEDASLIPLPPGSPPPSSLIENITSVKSPSTLPPRKIWSRRYSQNIVDSPSTSPEPTASSAESTALDTPKESKEVVAWYKNDMMSVSSPKGTTYAICVGDIPVPRTPSPLPEPIVLSNSDESD